MDGAIGDDTTSRGGLPNGNRSVMVVPFPSGAVESHLTAVQFNQAFDLPVRGQAALVAIETLIGLGEVSNMCQHLRARLRRPCRELMTAWPFV
jgi:hypothetical protein